MGQLRVRNRNTYVLISNEISKKNKNKKRNSQLIIIIVTVYNNIGYNNYNNNTYWVENIKYIYIDFKYLQRRHTIRIE